MKKTIIVLLFLFAGVCLKAQPFSLDTTFRSVVPVVFSPFVLNQVHGLIHEPGGTMLVYGNFDDFTHQHPNSLRCDYSGNLVNTWTNLADNTTTFYRIVLNNNSYFMCIENAMGKMYSNGSYDTSWYNNTRRCFTWDNSWPVAFHLFPDQRMLLGGSYRFNPYPGPYTYRHLLRLHPNGMMDTTFTHDANGHIYELLPYNNHQFIAGGQFTQYDSVLIRNVCRIDTTGDIDTTFKSIFVDYTNLDFIPTHKPRYVQDDGKIIVSGSFKIKDCPDTLFMVRLNTDGSLDSTFNNFNNIKYKNRDYIMTVCKTTDGGYLIGGKIDEYQGYSRKNILKTDVNGFIDTNYFNNCGIDSTIHWYDLIVNKIESAPGGQYYVMGCFRRYCGQLVPPIIRINSITHGVNEINKPQIELTIYPNPASTNVKLKLNPTSKSATLQVFTLWGNKVESRDLPAGTSEYTLPIAHYSKGIYMVRLQYSDGTQATSKMVKQ